MSSSTLMGILRRAAASHRTLQAGWTPAGQAETVNLLRALLDEVRALRQIAERIEQARTAGAVGVTYSGHMARPSDPPPAGERWTGRRGV